MIQPAELETKLRIGTSGYVFDDWVGPFYPKGLARAQFLPFYARHFPVVEINATYYRIPPPRTMAVLAARTPPEFRFVVKAHRSMTHEASRDEAVYRAFEQTLLPLRESGKLDGVLAQFPFGVKNTAAARAHLTFLRERLADAPLWAEFRHASWDRPAVHEFLRRTGTGYCAVDEPRLDGLMPGTCVATTPLGYVRFHGRNAATWWGGGHERYDWNYAEEELGEWLDRIRDLAARTDRTYVFFNNCYMGRAVRGARLLRRLLGLPTELDLGF